jgi:serine kinase of HPr protein (carbohydrate metabolism regulator)
MCSDSGYSDPTCFNPNPGEIGRHATCVVLGEAGVLIEGPSGVGKSRIALAALDLAASRGRFARLIGDDRIFLEARSGRLIARGHPAVKGKIEKRGEGIADVPFESRAVIRVSIELFAGTSPGDLPPRLPSDEDNTMIIEGISVPLRRLAMTRGDWAVASAILSALDNFAQD